MKKINKEGLSVNCINFKPKPYLPDDIIFEILVRVPANLAPFTSVCRLWKTIIESSKFSEARSKYWESTILISVFKCCYNIKTFKVDIADPREAVEEFVDFLEKETKFLGIKDDIKNLVSWILRHIKRYYKGTTDGEWNSNIMIKTFVVYLFDRLDSLVAFVCFLREETHVPKSRSLGANVKDILCLMK